MLKKETVVFVCKTKSLSVIENIKRELLNTGETEVVVLDKRELENTGRRFLSKITSPFVKGINAVGRIFGKENTVKGVSSICPKRLINMFFRFVPICLLTDCHELLSSINLNRGKVGAKTRICSFCSEITFDERLISDVSEYYFVDNIEARNKIVRKGILSDKIFVDSVPCEPEYFLPFDKEEISGRYFKNDGNKKVVIAAEWSNGKMRDLISFAGNKYRGTDFIVYVGTDKKAYNTAHEKGVAVYDKSSSRREVFMSADIIITRGDTATVKRAAAMNIPIIIFGAKSKTECENAKYLVADNCAVIANNQEDLKKALDGYDNGTLNLKNDFIDEFSAQNIAKEILNLIHNNE